MSAPTVYLIDDDAAVRDSLRMLCETAGLIVEDYDGAESFLASYQDNQAGCLVLDVRMGNMSGPELHAHLNGLGCRMPVIFLTAYGDIPMSVQAVKAGAVDFLTKPVKASLFLDRVQAALAQHMNLLDEKELAAQRCLPLSGLTQRERDVMVLALAGLANKVIAQRLGISHRTVELHRANLLRKTGMKNLLQLSKLVEECGLDTRTLSHWATGSGKPGPDMPSS